jgi:type IX secretion system PorP/SprF family membrane protein
LNLRPILAFCYLYLFCSGIIYGQHFNFAQYNYTPLKINPGLVATDNEAKAILHFRNQQTTSDVAFKSNMLTTTYPLLSKKTKQRWGGLGLSVLDDRSEGAGTFINQSIALNFAYNIPVKSTLQLSIGVQGNYNLRRFSADGVQTGSQYRMGSYDPSQESGENFSNINQNNLTFSSGFFLYNPDKEGRKKFYSGFSIYDFNRPNVSVSGERDQLASTLIITGGYRVFENKSLDITPELLYTLNSGISNINVGSVFSFNLKNTFVSSTGRFDLGTRYVVGKTGILSLQLTKPNYFVGFSYDLSVKPSTVESRQNGIELAFGVKKTIKPGVKKKSKKKNKEKKKARKKAKRKAKQKKKKTTQNAKPLAKPQEAKVVKTESKVKQAVIMPKDTASSIAKSDEGNTKEEIVAKAKADSVVKVRGIIKVNEILRNFEFDFNSTHIKGNSKNYLDHLASLLAQYPELIVTITGHTDNVGDSEDNLQLSQKRALVVKEYLIKRGIAADRVIAEGKGESEPMFSNDTEIERAKNRRVDFKIND